MKVNFIRIGLILFMLMQSVIVLSQDHPDSTQTKKTSLTKKAYKEGLKAITARQKDTVRNESSTQANAIYQGKIIRHIYVQSIDLKRSIYDSTKRTKKFVTDIADALHGTTRESVIRNHLFIEENKPLNPYELADNERYLRDLDFILDSRILASPVPGSDDSVDVTITTRDVFSLGINVGGSIPTAPEISLYDVNLFGRGQRVGVTTLVDPDRDPAVGYNASYRKSSIFGSLASLEFAYSQLNGGRSYGEETEFAYFVRLTRPLVSPYSRLAGGLEFSNNWSENVYSEPDSSFLKYNYKIRDGWLGYNIGINSEASNRNRHMISARFFDGYYLDQPDQEEYSAEQRYNNTTGLLGQYTFYQQNYYKTRYVFGFGRTEDVPYGVSFSLIGGYMRQQGLKRPYAGVDWAGSFANRKGNFYLFTFQTGLYYEDQSVSDMVVNTTVSYVTRALNLNRYKMRAYALLGYAQLFDSEINAPIEIDDSEVRGFDADSVFGDYKARIRLEAVLYTPWELFGFRFAPFLGVDDAIIHCPGCEEESRVNVLGFSAGFRTRNENLIFGTMEVRLNYIPETPVTPSQFSFEFKQRLRVKNTSKFVKPPNIVRY
ncbi:MAG TPA: hypothetical protein VGK59_16635 [Ohtaekwangia sp.]